MRRVTVIFLGLIIATVAGAKGNLALSKHNLSVSGPGQYKSTTETRLCVFCHTPHRGSREAPLWNRRSGQFANYQSSTMDASKAKNRGPSALCLSCHDGTVALGDMLIKPGLRRGQPDGLRNEFLKGRANLKDDLSDDHPVAIVYDDRLQSTDPDLVDPNMVDLPMKDNELQCTTCHDPHDDTIAPFLHKSTLNGELCTNCHLPSGRNWSWPDSSHAQSDATPRGTNPWPERRPDWAGKNVKENACMNCHAPHNAATPARLKSGTGEKNCLKCHNGMVARKNVQADLQKFFGHSVMQTQDDDHETTVEENPFTMPLHVECEDCHNPHASRPEPPMISFNPSNPGSPEHSQPPFVNGALAGVPGIDIGGAFKPEAEYEYEVCFRCHGVPGKSACDMGRCRTATGYDMARHDGVYNLRDKFDPGNSTLLSYHPVASNNPANNGEASSLRHDIPLDQISSLIYCSDCHNSENSAAAGGRGSSGPHGSRHEGILAMSYDLSPKSTNSAMGGRLCFKCHSRYSLYSDGSFPHRQHVIGENTACVNCHDPHGSATYPKLVNFLTSANVYGQMYEITGTDTYRLPTWQIDGQKSGTCYLTCHGVVHDGWKYPPSNMQPTQLR